MHPSVALPLQQLQSVFKNLYFKPIINWPFHAIEFFLKKVYRFICSSLVLIESMNPFDERSIWFNGFFNFFNMLRIFFRYLLPLCLLQYLLGPVLTVFIVQQVIFWGAMALAGLTLAGLCIEFFNTFCQHYYLTGDHAVEYQRVYAIVEQSSTDLEREISYINGSFTAIHQQLLSFLRNQHSCSLYEKLIALNNQLPVYYYEPLMIAFREHQETLINDFKMQVRLLIEQSLIFKGFTAAYFSEFTVFTKRQESLCHLIELTHAPIPKPTLSFIQYFKEVLDVYGAHCLSPNFGVSIEQTAPDFIEQNDAEYPYQFLEIQGQCIDYLNNADAIKICLNLIKQEVSVKGFDETQSDNLIDWLKEHLYNKPDCSTEDPTKDEVVTGDFIQVIKNLYRHVRPNSYTDVRFSKIENILTQVNERSSSLLRI
jgi:hypothetical protein